MILLLLPEERAAAVYAGALQLKREERFPFFFAPGEELAVAAAGKEPATACGIAGYALGVLSSQDAGRRPREIALAVAATDDLGSGAPVEHGAPGVDAELDTDGALLGILVRHRDARFYPDPLLLSGLPLVEIDSRYLVTVLTWASRLAPTDLLYPLLLPSEGALDSDVVRGVTSYLSALLPQLPGAVGVVTPEEERRIDALGDALMLSFGAKQQLRRSAKARIIREGALPEELEGYETLSVTNRAEGERLYAGLLRLLGEDTDG